MKGDMERVSLASQSGDGCNLVRKPQLILKPLSESPYPLNPLIPFLTPGGKAPNASI